jgi:tRNA dimethylallyltransferase
MPTTTEKPILIAGPTASGKSLLALALAEQVGGVVINADSMQVYRELRILTARPSPQDEAHAPHLLYGHVSAAEPYSVARWLEDVQSALRTADRLGRRPIIVGGTGLYFKALLEGLSPVPTIPADVRRGWRAAAGQLDRNELHGELSRRDPIMAARLQPADRQRITRALEVIDATGRSLADWQRQEGIPVLEAQNCVRLLVDRPRTELQARADGRFGAMLEAGALDEVRSLMGLGLPLDAPALSALGVQPLADVVANRMSIENAADRTRLLTRQYIKRQQTWLKRHMMSWTPVKTIENCKLEADFVQIID